MSEQEELFKIEESLSPMAIFIKKHDIKTHFCKGYAPDEDPWCVYTGDLEEYISNHELVVGNSKEQVIYEFAKKYKLEGWGKLDWD